MSMLTIANKMKPSKTMVGPFTVEAVDDYVRAKLVVEQKVPITLYEERDGEPRYAILAPPGKDLRIVCVGCFQPGMTLFDDSRCKKISSYCQHWDMNKGLGLRRNECKTNDTLQDCIARAKNYDETEPTNQIQNLSNVDTGDLMLELAKRKQDFEYILPKIETDVMVKCLKTRGVDFLHGCRPDKLEQELRRVIDPSRPSAKSFYSKKKSTGRPHYTDEPMITEEVTTKYFSKCGGLHKKETPTKKRYGTRSKTNEKEVPFKKLKK